MYTPDQLGSIYGDWNPEAYMQGRHQVDLSNQFQDQSLEQQRQKTQQDTLATQFTAQNNPLKLQNQQLTNEGLGYENVDKGVKARINAQTEGLQLDAAKMKQILSASDDQIKMMANQAQQMSYSDDPAVQQKGLKLMQLSAAAVEARQKHKDEMEKQDLIRKSAERVAGITAGAHIEAAKIGAAARTAAKVADPNVVAAKLGYEKGAAYYTIQAENSDDPAERQKFLDMAQRFEKANLAQKNAAATGKVDVGAATGMPTQQAPLSLVPSGAAQVAPKHSFADVQKMYPGVPPEKIKQAYKQKYGVDLQ